MFKTPKKGIYSFTSSFVYTGSDLEYCDSDITFFLYRRIEVGRLPNLNYRWYKFWSKEPKTIPDYEYEFIDTVKDRSAVELSDDLVVFTGLRNSDKGGKK